MGKRDRLSPEEFGSHPPVYGQGLWLWVEVERTELLSVNTLGETRTSGLSGEGMERRKGREMERQRGSEGVKDRWTEGDRERNRHTHAAGKCLPGSGSPTWMDL